MAKDDTKTVERVVRAQFTRYTKLVSPPGSDATKAVIVSARRGETIQVLESEAARDADLNLGTFHDDAEITHTPEGDVVEVDVKEMSDADLAAWIRDDKPKGDDVVALAGKDPELAERLLNAERTATDGQPRKNVNEPLTRIIDERTANRGTPGEVPVETFGTP